MSSSRKDPVQRVRDNRQRHRFEALVEGGGVAGWISYRTEGELVVLVHTQVDDAYEGQGVGSRLVRSTLAIVEERGGTVLPECPFVLSYLKRHPDLVELVPADRRAELGLGERSA